MTSEALDGQLQSCYAARARPKCLWFVLISVDVVYLYDSSVSVCIYLYGSC